jgi:hypothetical protein
MHFKITVTEPKPDDKGKIQFVLDWVTEDGRKRGQYFRTVLSDHLKHLESNGHTVEVIPFQR